jgi:hypothetical protein
MGELAGAGLAAVSNFLLLNKSGVNKDPPVLQRLLDKQGESLAESNAVRHKGNGQTLGHCNQSAEIASAFKLIQTPARQEVTKSPLLFVREVAFRPCLDSANCVWESNSLGRIKVRN